MPFYWGGVAAVIYEEILGKTNFKKMRKQNYFIEFALFPIIIFISMFIGIKIIKINPLYTTYIGFLISTLVIWRLRKDLFVHSVLSGLFLSIIYFLLGAFILIPIFPQMVKRWWYLQNLSEILIMGLPLEEILWAFTFGLFIGPAYEFLMGLQDRRLPSTKG